MAILKFQKKVLVFFAIFGAIACAKSGDGAAPAGKQSPPPGPVVPAGDAPTPTPVPTPAEPPPTRCANGADMKAGSKTLAEVRKGLKGQFDVASVVVQQIVKDQRRGEVTWAERSFQAYKDRSGLWRENRLPDCVEGVHATLDMSVLVPQIVHFGSGRITVFNAGDSQNRTATNFPSIRQLAFSRDELIYVLDRESLGRKYLYITDIPAMNPEWTVSFEETSKDRKRGFMLVMTQTRALGTASLLTLVRVTYLPDSIVH